MRPLIEERVFASAAAFGAASGLAVAAERVSPPALSLLLALASESLGFAGPPSAWETAEVESLLVSRSLAPPSHQTAAATASTTTRDRTTTSRFMFNTRES